jgi:tetratricopeptide (TPR) repeat protein
MLTEPEQVMFRRLAVFRGGWNLMAAEAVLPGHAVEPAAVLDLLDSLVRKSLVTVEATANGTRYRMLETLRQYAEEHLHAVPGERADVVEAHADHYLTLAEQAETGLRGAAQGQWLERLRQDHDNLGAALGRLVSDRADADRALRLAGSLGLYWHMGRHLEGRRVLGAVLALPGGSPAARARALQALSLVERPRACIVHPSEQCAAAALESLHLFEQAGDRRRAALSRMLLAVEGVGADPTGEAAGHLAASDEEFARLGDDWGRAVVAFVRMEIQFKRGNEASARAAAKHAVDLFRSLDDGWGLSAVLYHYGYGLQRFGAYAEAVDLLGEAVEVAAAAGVHNTVQWATADLGLALLSLGRLEEASAHLARAGLASQQVGDDAGRLLARYADALLAERRGDHALARESFAAAHEGFSRLGVWLATGLAVAGVARCDAASGDTAAAHDAYSRILELADTSGEVTLLLLGLEGLAAMTVDDDPVSAAEQLGRAAALRESLDRPPTDDERAVIDRVMERAGSVPGGLGYRPPDPTASRSASSPRRTHA